MGGGDDDDDGACIIKDSLQPQYCSNHVPNLHSHPDPECFILLSCTALSLSYCVFRDKVVLKVCQRFKSELKVCECHCN